MQERKIVPIVENYNIKEVPLYNKLYLFIKGYATGRKFSSTLKALPLARMVHNGQYRKGLVEINGEMVQLPYVLHVLKVCSTLMSLDLPMTDEELDLLYAAAILHDSLEDGAEYFPKGGLELEQKYHMPGQIIEIIQLLSKHTGADEYEINAYFNKLKENKFALLIKMADRSHNVEDLYNMKNIPKYIKETKEYFLGGNSIATYGKQNYPELSSGITILKSKILSLTEATETMLTKNQHLLDEKDKEIAKLKEKIRELEFAAK